MTNACLTLTHHDQRVNQVW